MSIYTPNPASLSTAANDEDGQYYDQAVCFTQRGIFEAFGYLFYRRPELKELIYGDEFDHPDTLKATLSSPQVVLNMGSTGDGSPRIFYRFNFASGSFIMNKVETLDIGGWSINIEATLDEARVSPHPDNDEEEAAAAKEAMNEIQKTHNFNLDEMSAGLCSLHRIFVSVSEHQWNNPHYNSSHIRIDGKGIGLYEWIGDGKNKKTIQRLMKCLSKWASNHWASPMFTVGLHMRRPHNKDQHVQSAFAPTSMSLQLYPFIEDEERLKREGKKKSGIAYEWNCVVVCETTQNRPLPKARYLPYTGNFVGPDAINDGPSGAITLDHRYYLDSLILPRLQELCFETQVIPLIPVVQNGELKASIKPRIVVGGNPMNHDDYSALPDRVASHPNFAFSSRRPREYFWGAKIEAPGSVAEKDAKPFPSTDRTFGKYKTTSETSVSVTWKPGGEEFTVSGCNTFEHWEGYWMRLLDVQPDRSATLSERVSTIKTTWSFTISLHVSDGFASNVLLKPKILGCHAGTYLPLNFESKVENTTICGPMDSNAQLSDMIKHQIEQNLKHAMKRIASHLSLIPTQIGSFTYPVSGKMEFGRPTITEHGNILATLSHHKIDSSGIVWRSAVKKYDPVSGRVRITIDGMNDSNYTTTFDMIKIIPLSTKAGIALFNKSDLSWKQLVHGDRPASPWCWSLVQKNITPQLTVHVNLEDQAPAFYIRSKEVGASDELPHSRPFAMLPHSSFTLELDGTTPKPGVYVLQLSEVWNATQLWDGWERERGTDAFIRVSLVAATCCGTSRLTKSEVEPYGIVKRV